MAKKAQEKTEAAKKVLDLRQKLSTAKEADAKASTDRSKAIVTALTADLAKAVEADNRERFIRVAGSRAKKVRLALRNLAACAQPRSYKYDEADVAKAESTLATELKTTLNKLRSALTRGPATKEAEEDIFA